jgi:TetR/AcrR family acrAB operon transcriptional repressor
MSSPSRRSNRDRREQSTEQVLAAALKLFVSNGYTATSIDDIATEAGLTKGAVYFYFRGNRL